VAFREYRIVELAASFQVGTQSAGLSLLHHQGQFEQKGWRFLFWGLVLPGLLCAHQPHAFSCTRTSLPSLTGFPTSVKPLRCSCAARSPRLPKQGTALHPPDESRGLSRSVFCKEQMAFRPGIAKEAYNPKGRDLFDHILAEEVSETIVNQVRSVSKSYNPLKIMW